MIRMLLGVLTALMAVVMTLVAMLVLVKATLIVSEMTNPVARGGAVMAELVLGVALLVGTIYSVTRLAVRIFGNPPPKTNGS